MGLDATGLAVDDRSPTEAERDLTETLLINSESEDEGGLVDLAEQRDPLLSESRSYAELSSSKLYWDSFEPSVQRALRIAVFFAVLTVAYFVNQFFSIMLRIPEDGIKHWNSFHIAEDFNDMFNLGFILAWFARVDNPDRFRKTSTRWMTMIFIVVCGAGPVFSAISDVHGLQHSLTDISGWDASMWVVLSVGMLVFGAMVVVFIWHAVINLSRASLAVFVGSRLVVLLFYSCCIFFSVHHHRNMYRVHVHHLYFGWLLGCFAEFDTWWSNMALAVGTGLFIQGCSAYNFATMVEQKQCFHTIAEGNMSCLNTGPDPWFMMEVCLLHGDAKCTTTAPFYPPPPPPSA
mmetsp:Transcript_545/g.633  ORF Transcript_545/g.633 Transcript_545/m.633 type:complete len:347 (+) Transcript_545:357-1397(+)|eukprot:CAMPEP_0197861452 /NCGR_PEP_ID=MMETSP1438-20131217/37525_1 /TAXON_ID=1461541 /ORGANISM="Pterosperma sp., Strain CCMP1384" /LENGTH=346 /DNA_ID=CAMNT_0043478637 /DNA_START=349 /DNA_END=1389 /DNA_ORIENTATION=+